MKLLLVLLTLLSFPVYADEGSSWLVGMGFRGLHSESRDVSGSINADVGWRWNRTDLGLGLGNILSKDDKGPDLSTHIRYRPTPSEFYFSPSYSFSNKQFGFSVGLGENLYFETGARKGVGKPFAVIVGIGLRVSPKRWSVTEQLEEMMLLMEHTRLASFN